MGLLSFLKNPLVSSMQGGKNLVGNITTLATDSKARAAFSTKHFGTTGIGKRIAVAGAYGAAYGAFSTALGFFEDERKAYLGEERYNQYYGAGVSSLRGLAGTAAIALGGSALLGKDPIIRAISEAKYRGAQIAARSSAANFRQRIKDLGDPKEIVNKKRRSFSDFLKEEKLKSGSSMQAHTDVSAAKKGKMPLSETYYGRAKQRFLEQELGVDTFTEVRRADVSVVRGGRSRAERRRRYTGLDRPGQPKPMDSGMSMAEAEENMVRQGKVLRKRKYKTVDTRKDDGDLSNARATEYNQQLQRKKDLLTKEMTESQGVYDKEIAKLKSTPRLLTKKNVKIAASIAGGGGALSFISEKASPMAVPYGIAGAAAGYAGYQVAKSAGIGGTMLAVGAAAATYASVNRLSNALPAEGNIIDFSTQNSGGVSKMNFSTAGLVQALHAANRKY
jgi:hypothetical protein